MTPSDKEAEAFKMFISNRRVLVADAGSSSRTSIIQNLVQLGAKPFLISSAGSIQEAQEEMNAKKPDIVLAEYTLGRACGLDLLQTQRKTNPDFKKCLFMLLTSNNSQAAVARAAEEDVDAFILKPFTPAMLRKTIIKNAILKIQPPPYLVEIEAGKAKLAELKFDEADEHFHRATKLDSQPALALYYLGQSKQLREVLAEAKGSYQKGLDYNKIHYKCMVGLYELMMSQKAFPEAYTIVKRLSQYFPANPKRLAEVLRLAIINKSYEDVEKYYAVFCNFDERDDELVNYICAALVVCGKYYLMTHNRARALELFQKAAVTSAGRVKVLREIVQNLVAFRMPQEAQKFLERFPLEMRKTADYLLADLMVFNLTSGPTAVVSKGRKLLEQGIHSEAVFEMLIKRAIETQSISVAEGLIYEGSSKYPHAKERFEALMGEVNAA